MSAQMDPGMTGKFEARYVAFLETISHLRPSLHRYCARMTGSVTDGEDIVQEALFEAYRKLDKFDETRPLSPWLFRIAHNRSIDFLRRRGVRQETETAAMEPDVVEPAQLSSPPVGRAVEHLVLALPPMERACVLLKDVFDYTLEETAELVDSTVGGVKAALNRGRTKLAKFAAPSAQKPAVDPELVQLSRLYVERFNRRDWDGLRELISADARLTVADRFRGRMDESGYFGVYSRWPQPLWLATGEVDGRPAIIIHGQSAEGWVPHAFMTFEIENHHVARVKDYIHCPWVLSAASEIVIDPF
ncbi:MAG TPA: sigma-70 family RNA polymerase sigma factor [Terriglobales bacterium]